MDGGALGQSRRGFHVELGAREKDLLAENDALRRFKSHKKGVRQLKRIGDVITAVVVAGIHCYTLSLVIISITYNRWGWRYPCASLTYTFVLWGSYGL
ncbi:unnamed protein product [Brassica rapa]|uniref:Uncharacterized protein n=1 Tax=Brassica campestris TaxID=3711 RepID=A0A8D9D896_BRACM|nr:unnamed protein product [Brassica rapa]